jgi:predicted porin
MQKKILSLAVAAAVVSAPAFADTANVTVYGKVYASVDSLKSDNVGLNAPAAAGGAAVSNRLTGVHSNASRLGFKGEEDLGDGLKAVYQYEAEFNLDANSTAGTSQGAFLGTRNSDIGLQGGFGTLFVGNWDTPFKLAHNAIELNDNTTFGSANNLIGRFSAAGTSFSTRLKDSVNYHSPKMAGFQIMASYGSDDAKKAQTAVPAVAPLNQTVNSLSGSFENDMFFAAIATQNFKDLNATGTTGASGDSSSGLRLVGDVKFGANGFVGITVEDLKAKVAATGIESKRRAIEVAGKYAFGAQYVAASYVKANNRSDAGVDVPNTNANQLTLRYGYNFSKRTELYAMYTSLKNGLAANYNFSSGNGTAVANSQNGANLTGLGVGMIHSF